MGPASAAGASPMSAWLEQLSAVQPEKMKCPISLGVMWSFPFPGSFLGLGRLCCWFVASSLGRSCGSFSHEPPNVVMFT